MKFRFLLFVGALMAAGGAQAQDAPALMKRNDCYICHDNEQTKTGPAFADIAAKYRGDSKAIATLTAVVKKGRHGSGPWPMPPLPQVPSADARKIAEYILSLKK
jgi:cytochrome c